MDNRIAPLQQALGHEFVNPALLEEALTHPSISGMSRRSATKGYERLEFLGDRVLGLVVAQWLLERFPKEQEGALARRLTALVRAEALVVVAERIGLGRHLNLAPSEQVSDGGSVKPAILADACEALIGALYLDGGLDAAAAFIRRHWDGALEGAKASPPQDPKTGLQEWALARGQKLPLYTDIGRSGPDHAPVFQVSVQVDGQAPVTASGPSKRAAEKAAAETLLSRIRNS